MSIEETIDALRADADKRKLSGDFGATSAFGIEEALDALTPEITSLEAERDAAQEKAESWERWAHEKAPEVEGLAAKIAALDAGIQSALAAVPDDIADAAGGELIPAIERLTKHYFRLHGKVHDACQALPDDIRIAADGDLVAGLKGLEAAYQVERKAVESHARELAQMRQVNAELRERLDGAEHRLAPDVWGPADENIEKARQDGTDK